MPELPEVERVRRTLEPHLLHQTILEAVVFRKDVVRGGRTPTDLLAGRRIVRLDRLGKQLALVGDDGGCICIHLGMSGSLRFSTQPQTPDRHVHVRWTLPGGAALVFRDPRRFGGVWTFPSEAALRDQRWRNLGPDALRVTPGELHALLSRKRLALKAALLDQGVVAGLGNIYVDELLHVCRLSPLRPACGVDAAHTRCLVRRMRTLLASAIRAGGSTLRDYADANGTAGGFQTRHRVYGRGGQPCLTCRAALSTATVAGRSTVYCDYCQRL